MIETTAFNDIAIDIVPDREDDNTLFSKVEEGAKKAYEFIKSPFEEKPLKVEEQ